MKPEVFVRDDGRVVVTYPGMCVLTFQQGRFNDTQEVEWLCETTVTEAARVMRVIAEFLMEDHPRLIGRG